MPTSARFVFLLLTLLVFTTATTVFAQSEKVETARTAPLVTASTTGERVRFVSPVASVVQIRLEVFYSSGEKLFDSEFRRGNIIDWSVAADGQKTSALQDDSVLFVVTVRTLSGQLRQRHGLASVQDGRVTLRRTTSEGLAPAQAQAWEMSPQTLAPGEQGAGEEFTVLSADATEQQAATVTAHDGRDGQLTSTVGALTLRTGDVFAGKDVERVRITPEGNVGIGTDKPEATLDVAGSVRAREGLMFSDGSTLNVNEKGVLTRTSPDGTAPSAVSSTQNNIAKFTDNAGTLGDSSLTDVGGNVGLGVASPVDLLDIAGAPNGSGRSGLHVRTTTTTGNSTLYFDNDRGNFSAYGGLLTGGSANTFSFFGVTRADKTFLIADGPSSLGLGIGTLVSQPVIFGTANAERMRIDSAGSVGIGTTNPLAKLHVNGNVNFTGLRTETDATSPNVIGGFSGNSVTANVVGATISGGGNATVLNRVTDDYGTVGGGINNRAGNNAGATSDRSDATVGGGAGNTASAFASTVGGGTSNTASGPDSSVGGGFSNSASGSDATIGGGKSNNASGNQSTISGGDTNIANNVSATVSGGVLNTASGPGSTIGGGGGNAATGFEATIGGGADSSATGNYATVPGGQHNKAQGPYSFAVGQSAQALHQGTFVWSDSTASEPNFFSSTANDQFLINASGGVGIGFNAPANLLHVRGVGREGGGVPSAPEVVSHFEQPADTQHAAISVDASGATAGQPAGRDAIVYFAKGGSAVWDLRNDADVGDKFQLRYQVGAANSPKLTVQSTGEVGIGTASPGAKLDVNGTIKLATLGAGTGVTMCRAASGIITDCSASSLRYKEHIIGLRRGLDLIMRLRPVTFSWKSDGQKDLGLVAEEVNKVEPLLTHYNEAGEVHGVKYDRLNVVLVSAVQQQQEQINAQQQKLAARDARVADLEARLASLERSFNHLAAKPQRRHPQRTTRR